MLGLRRTFQLALYSLVALTACDSPENPGTAPSTTVTGPDPSPTVATTTTTSSSPISSTPGTPTTSASTTTTTTATPSTTGASTSSGGPSTAVTTPSSSSPADTNSTGDGVGASLGSAESEPTVVGETSAPVDPCGSALLCDNFDDDTVGMAPGQPWKSDSNGGAVAVSSDRAFSGDKSVHVSNAPGQYARAYFSVDGAPAFPGAGAELYGRMMMWVDKSPADGVHWTFIQGEGPSDDNSYRIFYRYGGQHAGKLMANFETEGVASDCWNHSQTVMPTQKWTCLEWRFNTATDEMEFWLDGAELQDLHVVGQGQASSGCVSQSWNNTWPAPKQFDTLRLGLEKYQQDGQLDLWIDDVAVGASRVGCPAAR